ncbi:MAG TPA: hypothetical protein VKF79_06870 [Candidatus Acidoferrum sp.]|nr:hypothetical protein [Candidatus Acidoferrum sp.]
MADTSSSGDSSSSKSLMWMMVALTAGLGVMLGGGLFIANTLLHSMTLAVATGNKNTVRTPIGSFRLQKQDQIGPGLPVYPRASMQMPGSDSAGQIIQDAQDGITAVTYYSADDRDAIDNWYAQHLSTEFSRHDASERPLPEAFRAVRVTDGDITFLAARGNNIRALTLSQEANGTRICLMQIHAKSSEATPDSSSAPPATTP